MALRNQPYFPLYVQDFLTDEKLNECSAESTGVYIKLMCLMHKSSEYGTFLLKQKYKQTDKQIKNFALNFARLLPFDEDVIERSLTELVSEGVLSLDGDILFQKRMVKDNELSNIRALAGKKGGKKNLEKNILLKQNDKQNKNFAQAKSEANSENEIEIDIINENNIKDISKVEEHTTLRAHEESGKSDETAEMLGLSTQNTDVDNVHNVHNSATRKRAEELYAAYTAGDSTLSEEQKKTLWRMAKEHANAEAGADNG